MLASWVAAVLLREVLGYAVAVVRPADLAKREKFDALATAETRSATHGARFAAHVSVENWAAFDTSVSMNSARAPATAAICAAVLGRCVKGTETVRAEAAATEVRRRMSACMVLRF